MTAGQAVRWLSGAATELGGLILFLLPGAPALTRFLFENKGQWQYQVRSSACSSLCRTRVFLILSGALKM